MNPHDEFQDFMDGRFRLKRGPAHDPERRRSPCNKKLCFFATDVDLLAEVLRHHMFAGEVRLADLVDGVVEGVTPTPGPSLLAGPAGVTLGDTDGVVG